MMLFRDKPENELLVCCARTLLDLKTTDRIHSLVQDDIDWEYVVRRALRHRVMPLLYRNLKTTCPQDVPDDILAKLRNYFLINSSRNLFLSSQVLKLLNLLKENGIVAIPFKGPVLAESVYGDLTLRQFADLDILVHKRNAIKARNLLISNGFRPEIELNRDQVNAYLRSEYYFTVLSNDGRVFIELHWEIAGRNSFFPLYVESLQDRLEQTALAGKEVRHISPEDLLLYLCIHGNKDSWMNLEQICCVAELMRSHPEMDWMLITRIAKRLRCERILFLGLFMAHDLFRVTLAEKILRRIEGDTKVPKLAEKVYESLFDEPKYVPGEAISSRFLWFQMQVRDRFEEKIRYASYLIFRPTVEDWRKLPLPAQLWFLHYLYRPVRLIVGLMLVLMRRYLIKSKGITPD